MEKEELVDDLVVIDQGTGNEADEDVDELERGEDQGRLLAERIQRLPLLQ